MCDNCKDAKHRLVRLEPTKAGRHRDKMSCSVGCQCHDAFNFVVGNVPMQVSVTA